MTFRLIRISLFMGILSTGLLISCHKKDPIPSPTLNPIIDGFSPTSGSSVGTPTTVTIAGANFSISTSANQVTFNGVAATVSAATKTQIITVVPSGATSGKIRVTVDGQTVTSATDFTVISGPTIVSFLPTSGVAGSSSPVIITGANFGPTISANEVKFNGITAIISAATTTQLTALLPAGATTGKITITSNGLPVVSTSDFIVIPSPSVTGFSPTHGLPGSVVTLSGTNLSGGAAAGSTNLIFKINGVLAIVVPNSTSNAQLQVTVPNAASTGKLTVESTQGGPALFTTTNDFEVLKDIPRNGLVAFYPFSGNSNDLSGNNLNATLMNGPVPSTDRFGTGNHSFRLDGNNDFIDMGNPAALQVANTFTISMWINTNSFSNTVATYVGKKYHTNTIVRGYLFGQVVTGTLPVLSGSVSSSDPAQLSYGFTAGSTDQLNSWMHVTYIINGKTIQVFRDGIMDYNFTNDARTVSFVDDASGGNLIVGGDIDDGGTFFFDGRVDDVTVYNRALSDAEVQQLFQQTITKY